MYPRNLLTAQTMARTFRSVMVYVVPFWSGEYSAGVLD
jgi:hypothetical protein